MNGDGEAGGRGRGGAEQEGRKMLRAGLAGNCRQDKDVETKRDERGRRAGTMVLDGR